MTIEALLKHLADFESADPAPSKVATPLASPKRARPSASFAKPDTQQNLSVLSALPVQAVEREDKDLMLTSREIEQKIAMAREEGRLEGQAAARREFDVKAEEIQRENRENFEASQQDWRHSYSSTMAAQVEEAVGGLERELAEAVSAILEPLVKKRQKEEILQTFCIAVRDLLCGGAGAGIVIEAPEEFAESIAIRSLCEGHFLDVRASAGGDLVARVDTSLVRARFAQWGEEVVQTLRSAA